MVNIESLLDLAEKATIDEIHFDAEYFKLVYCNYRIQSTIKSGSIALLIYAYPKTIIGKRIVIKHLKSIPYQDFLNTIYWQSISFHVKEKAKNRCEHCQSKYLLTVHHKTYTNKGHELFHLSDLICLCKNCHNKFHMI